MTTNNSDDKIISGVNSCGYEPANLDHDSDGDVHHTKKERPRAPYKHITVRGIILTTLACYTLGCITACTIIQSSIEKSHKMAMERDIFVQNSLGQLNKMNQESLNAMRHTVDSVFSSGIYYDMGAK